MQPRVLELPKIESKRLQTFSESMGLIILPCEDPDLGTLARVQMAAYHDHPLINTLFPKGQRPEHYNVFKSINEAQRANEPRARSMKVVDTEMGEMIAGSTWILPERQTERDTAAPKKPKVEPDLPEDFNLAVMGAAKERYSKFCEDFFHGEPYINFQTLVTRPEHQKRGAGTLLLKECLKQAKEERCQVALEATSKGRPFYEKLGFRCEKVNEYELAEGGVLKQDYMVKPLELD